MGYKTTTDIFELRASTDATITSTGGSAVATVDTSLDTLNREVLIIHEVDIRNGSAPLNAIQEMAGDTNGAKLSIANTVATEAGTFGLDDQEYVAGVDQEYVFMHGVATGGGQNMLIEARNPDSRTMPSKDKSPLAIVTSQSLTCRTGFTVSGISLSGSDTYQAQFRIYAQRAKADADTYAALVTGLL